MPLYSYQAYSKQGKKISGTIDAQGLGNAKDLLVKRGLYPISITAASASSGSSLWSMFTSRSVSQKDLIFFTKQLGILLSSGIPLSNAFDLLVDQSEGKLKNIVMEIRDNIREGKSLAESLAQYPKVFESIYIQLVRAGEASGKLEVILKRLQDYLEKRAEIKKKIGAAIRGPLIQLVIIFAAVVVLLVFVVPGLADMFKGKALPWTTQYVMNASSFIQSYYLYIIVALIGAYIAFRSFIATKGGKEAYDSFLLKIPIIGFFTRMNAIVQFSRTLGMLIEGGVNLSEALSIVTNITTNMVLKKALIQAKENIIKQGKIAEYLRQTNIFPPVAIYLINTGEQSGNLDAMLTSVGQYYERELDDYATSLTEKINPALMVIMALSVGFILLSIVQPMAQSAQAFM
jgi:type II secretory pathway component PulF